MPYPYPFTGQADAGNIASGAYCKVEDVQALFKNIGTYSTLDAAEIARRCADAAVEMDAMIQANYLTPVTGDAAALTILRLINSRLAAAVIGEVYGRSGESKQLPPQISAMRTWAELMIKDILAGTIRFFSAPLRSPGDLPQFPPGLGATFNKDNDADADPGQKPLFTRGGRGSKASLGDLI